MKYFESCFSIFYANFYLFRGKNLKLTISNNQQNKVNEKENDEKILKLLNLLSFFEVF